MNNKLQELTKKIYQEGLEKGQTEADGLIAKAKADAADIVNAAKKEAKRLIEEAENSAAEMKKNTESELSMSTKQAITTVKQHITNIVVDKSVSEAINTVFKDQDFLKNLMLKMAENWDQIEKGGKDVMFFLSEKEHKELESYLRKIAATTIKGGLEINFEEGIKSGFKLGPTDGSYKLSFTDKDFILFFTQYLRPRTRSFFTED